MRLAIHDLLAQGPPAPGAIDRFLGAHEVPLVEGRHVTFLFRGEADRVRLQHWVYGLRSDTDFQRVAGTDLWTLAFDLPPGSRVEYKLEVTRGGVTTLERDPLNPLLAHDPFGANSVCRGDGYAEPDWTLPDPQARRGTVTDVLLDHTPFGEPRRLQVYLPARFRPTRRYPLLVVHDGGDYLRYAALDTVLDNLVHRLEVAPLVCALSFPGERLVEYADDERHASFLAEQVVPRLERSLPLLGTPAGRCLMGASFGGVAALTTAARYPGRFGRLLLQSGSFAFTDIGENARGPQFERVVAFMNHFRESPRHVAERVYVSCGRYESLIYENRSIVPLLQEAGMQVRYEEARDGHNWENWRDRLRSALSWLFPGPLWMTYE